MFTPKMTKVATESGGKAEQGGTEGGGRRDPREAWHLRGLAFLVHRSPSGCQSLLPPGFMGHPVLSIHSSFMKA